MPGLITRAPMEKTKDWLTRRMGTPLTLKGPVTKRRPDPSCFKNTTRLPAKRPARTIKTVPGVMDSLSLVCRGAALRTARREGASSAAYQRGAFSATVRLPPLKSLTTAAGVVSCFLAGDFHSVGFLANFPRFPNIALRE